MDDAGTQRMLRSAITRTGHAWLGMVDHLRTANPVDALEQRLYYPQPLMGSDIAIRQFAAATHGVYLSAANAEARWLGAELDRVAQVQKKLIAFDVTDDDDWAEQNQFRLIREISAEQRALIQAALLEGQRTHANPREVARTFRDSIGLTDYQSERVASYRRSLESGDLSRALSAELGDGRYDRALRSAIDSGDVIPSARIDAMVQRYRANWIAYRAETIARTEGLRLAHQGSEALFRQSVDRGTIDAMQIERRWLHTHRKGERPGHAQMHGQTRGMGEAFETPGGVGLLYPCDPSAPPEETINCTCAVATRLKTSSGLRAV